jgi:hypothetical protein
VRVSTLAYGPAAAEAGMARVRSALRVLVPTPLPALAEARLAAVVPRPGAAGAMVPPRMAPGASEVAVGVQPSWLPAMVAPAAVPEPVKSTASPDTAQPG